MSDSGVDTWPRPVPTIACHPSVHDNGLTDGQRTQVNPTTLHGRAQAEEFGEKDAPLACVAERARRRARAAGSHSATTGGKLIRGETHGKHPHELGTA